MKKKEVEIPSIFGGEVEPPSIFGGEVEPPKEITCNRTVRLIHIGSIPLDSVVLNFRFNTGCINKQHGE